MEFFKISQKGKTDKGIAKVNPKELPTLLHMLRFNDYSDHSALREINFTCRATEKENAN